MDIFFYILFGFLDVFMILTFIFKIFRWPLFSYLKELIIIAAVCSFESYLTRMVFHISQYDLLIQTATIMLLMNYLLKVNFYYALSLSVIGALSYSEVVFFVYQTLVKLN